MLQTAGDGLRDVVQGEAADFFRRNVVLVAVRSVIGSAAYVDELHLSARASPAVLAVRVGLLGVCVFGGPSGLFDPGLGREVNVGDDVSGDVGAELGQGALLLVPFAGEP